VRVVIDLSQSFRVDVAVHLGRRQRGVAEQLLDRAQIGAAFQQVGGERVSQPVWMRHQSPQGRRIESPAAGGEKQRVLGAPSELRPRVAEIARNEAGGFLAEWNDAVLAALAEPHVHELLLEVDVGEFESDSLSAAKPRGVDELDERLVAERERTVALERVDDLFDLLLLRGVGQPARAFRRE
jgi:hypothetical protein